jgi:hypothetical protein
MNLLIKSRKNCDLFSSFFKDQTLSVYLIATFRRITQIAVSLRPTLKRPQAANWPQAVNKPQISRKRAASRKQAANKPQIGRKP